MKYLLSMYQPDGGPPPDLDLAPIMRELGKINDELKAAGAWVFAGGLADAPSATVVHAQKNGDVLITDGPYVEGKEHMGGFDIVDVADLDEALGWARRISEVTGLPMEVRPFRFEH
jgi:hypothetical protein